MFYNNIKEENGVVIIEPGHSNGYFNQNAAEEFITFCIDNVIETDHKNIVVNMKDVDKTDLYGVRALKTLALEMRERNGGVKLTHLSKQVRDILEIMELINIFEVFDEEETIVA